MEKAHCYLVVDKVTHYCAIYKVQCSSALHIGLGEKDGVLYRLRDLWCYPKLSVFADCSR